MLAHLFITNYALIDHIEIDFKEGLTTITGETGAGKSILLGALSLILGERADVKAVRNQDKKSIIEATFDISDYPELKSFFDENDIDYVVSECVLRREITQNGRSRAFINDTPVTLSVLQDLSLRLVDIHSQHSNMLLSKSDYQLRVVDSVSVDKSLFNEYKTVYEDYKKKSEKLTALKKENERRKQEEDYINFQYTQISSMNLQQGEDIELEESQKKLNNVSDIKSALWECCCMLRENESSILSQLGFVEKNLAKTVGFDKALEDVHQRVESSMIELKDLSMVLDTMQNDYVDDPQELSRVEMRLDSIYELENKHKVRSVDELIALQEKFQQQLNEITGQDEEIAELEKEVSELEKDAMTLAKKLSDVRRKGAAKFADELYKEAVPLGMKNLAFKIEVDTIPMGPDGIDRITFLFAFNKQQQMMPVENTASGGEVSRLMLCIKSIIAQHMKLPTIIFDEVDTGVSGDVANRMGEMMSNIGKTIQVITITHLPQVAVKGNNHLKVYKQDIGDATYTAIKELTAEDRINEVAGMLSGEKIDAAAIENAKSLLRMSNN